ncbi:condensin subunit Smc [Tamilnaduibacter salinus]|uniref:Chromosome partition protein Smc n=1 Tax=Tamilnaduibacter salinus TaxID=1484056 RepID=A0A2A2I4S1_9GAMM|nr:chromosome segregation protein SMC [Tamilnaduibacter salinus]PAV26296.1 chromosome segregation protein SMC [Tamilnaduibacter salinus]PVY78041.1 condensin subunit Smc [Tamilnaduibacter salinus]
MRLKSIKLAGFKSFVDPTTVPFPSNMSAVIGPNGCGKSNIIDAVRWVMGESSAKYLRGESMTDVIFNGSSARKPVGQASIELVFDNSDGSAPGQYAQFTDISVKRRVSREGQSDYFLNGSKCRRRDITDLFLGTGLGPRSYAIIEQGMISRLIEAKPEELRVYIEEAAGISRYKERRRETENRIRRTTENLERITDLRDELDRQLKHLEKQAETAERYKTLKQSERRLKAELTVLRWQGLDEELATIRERIQEMELEQERLVTERVNAESHLETLRDDHQARTDRFNEAQGRYYEAGADIARVEQNLDNQRERSRQMATELDQALADRRELDEELSQDQEKISQINEELAELEPEHEELKARSETSAEALESAELAMSDWQQEWEAFSSRASDARQRAELAQSRIRNTEDSLESLNTRHRRLEEERELLEGQLDRDELAALREEREQYDMQAEEAQDAIEQATEALEAAQTEQGDAESEAARLQGELQTARANLTSQEAILDEQLGGQDEALQDWLTQQQLDQQPRLAQRIRTSGQWAFAVEQVLGVFAQGVCVDAVENMGTTLADAPRGLTLVGDGTSGLSDTPGTLLEDVSEAGGLSGLLARIHKAESLNDALDRRNELALGESFLTPDGVWVGPQWLKMPDSDQGQVGVIERQRRVENLRDDVSSLESAWAEANHRLEAARERTEALDQRREEARQQLADAERERSTVASRVSGLEARAEQIESRLSRIRDDLEEVTAQHEEEQERLDEVRAVWQDALNATEDHANEKETLLGRRDAVRERLDQMRQQARHDRDHAHQTELQMQSLQSQQQGLKQTIERMQLQKERLDERIEILRENREEAEAPIEDLKLELEGLLDRRVAEEQKLSEARDHLEELDRQVREREQDRHRADQSLQEVRARLEKARMESQALEIRSGNQLEQLSELEVTLEEVRQQLPEDASESAWGEELEKVGKRIQRLGAINLAAIDEYQVQSERKTYLDEQHADLTEALETLENAIRRIDRETRQRFKETYDQVNSGLQALFPKVFGGGSASLELTGDDLLETGVSIMARPPGKKNTTIHLLSGGEKALTAIALVFSIFQLNPAPFCMLDEVDAPLDDANVARYARMVEEMSSQVQFIYITHNKISMEMADQLMGVTMHEPGVSRLVSVDVEEAAALAQA